MAIVKNFWLKNQTKKLAGAVIYQAMGQTRSRELAAEVSNPRTVDQMSQRVKWANLVNFYRANKSWMKFAFETKPTNRTDYNQFMSLNVSNSRIYLPKGIANQGGCVVDSYVMTQGSLPSIETTTSEAGWKTNLFLPGGFEIQSTTTVAEVSQALIQSNPALREGDQLSFIRLTQQTNSNTGVPFVVVRKYEVILNTSDLRFFFEFMPNAYILDAGENQGNCIEVNDSGNAGGFLLILSRTTGGKTYVSTQSIVVANNDALIQAYSSSNALQTAIDSYGESTEPFLTSTTAEQDTQAPVQPSIVSISGDLGNAVPGQIFGPISIDVADEFEVTLSETPTAVGAGSKVVVVKAGVETEVAITNANIQDGKVVLPWPSGAVTGEGYYVADIYAVADGTTYRAPFLVPNAAYEGGLE